METLFSNRIQNTPRSYIRDILQAAQDPSIISFAGGLPNAQTLPVTELAESAQSVLGESGSSALQYGLSQGYAPLREIIAARYRDRFGLDVTVDNILMTHGAQQGLFLLGEVMLNPGESVALEQPGFLGAFQALSLTEAELKGIPLNQDGLDPMELHATLDAQSTRLVYTNPNFQNPTGGSYSTANREEIAEIMASRYTLLIEDDPYGELRFYEERQPSFWMLLPEQTVMLGSFSKVVAPGLRLGWVCAPETVIEQLLIAKQATDLQTSTLTQRILYHYLLDHDVDTHIQHLRQFYRSQCRSMIAALDTLMPVPVEFTPPTGGMFLWLTLPEGISAEAVCAQALREKVAIVPGTAFYLNGEGDNKIRLNFSNASAEEIEIGIQRLARALTL